MTRKEISSESRIDTSITIKNPEQSTAESTRDRAAEVIAKNPEVRSEVLTPAELTHEHFQEVADYFRWTFNNEWPDYAVCPPCDRTLEGGMRLSAKQVYGTSKDVPLDVMDHDPKLPACPNCNQQMQIFHDPQKTRANMEKKLGPDGYVSLLRDAEKGGVVGFAFGYGARLQDGFEYEWGNPYGYMAEPDPAYARSFDHFLTRLNEAFPESHFDPDTEIFFWNCVALNPEVRGGGGYFMDVMRNLFNSLPPEKRKQYIIGEALNGSLAHGLFRTVGGKDVPGILEGQGIILRLEVGETTDRFNLSPEEFALLRRSMRKSKQK